MMRKCDLFQLTWSGKLWTCGGVGGEIAGYSTLAHIASYLTISGREEEGRERERKREGGRESGERLKAKGKGKRGREKGRREGKEGRREGKEGRFSYESTCVPKSQRYIVT